MRMTRAGLALKMTRAGLALMLAGILLLAAACGGQRHGPAAATGNRLYRQARTYTGCMRSHGVPDFPEPEPGPSGTLVYPLNPPAGMLSSPGYDTAFRACLKQAVTGGQPARYRAIALRALQQAECMRAHGITGFPAPAALNGGLHVPDYTTPGIDPHTLRFQAAGKACGMGGLWQEVWWWPATAQP